MEAVGILKVKNDIQVVSEKLSKREFVLTTEHTGNYPQQVSFQLVNDKCALLDHCAVGDELKIIFNLKGREWVSPQGETKYFNTLDAWKIERVGGNSTPAAVQPEKAKTNVTPPAQVTSGQDVFTSSTPDDDMPF